MFLYKYLPPERIDILVNATIRFTQPADFNDLFDSRPHVAGAFTESSAEQYLDKNFDHLVDEELAKYPAGLRDIVRNEFPGELASLKKAVPKQAKAHEMNLLSHITPSIHKALNDNIGILCLSEVCDSMLMWSHYSNSHRGFVIGFNAEHVFFKQKRTATDEFGYLRKVKYAKERPAISLQNTSSEEWFEIKAATWEYDVSGHFKTGQSWSLQNQPP